MHKNTTPESTHRSKRKKTQTSKQRTAGPHALPRIYFALKHEKQAKRKHKRISEKASELQKN